MSENATEAIRTEELVKKFGETTALSGASFTVRDGELFGLLGVNGAGKTTAIRILSGLIKQTSGEVFIFGKNVRTDMKEIKTIIAFSPQETSVAPNLTVKENLEFFASLYYSDKAERDGRIEEIVREFGLDGELKKRAKTLSGGWQRRLSIAIALISRPKVLFLDEPTLGLDVFARRELWRVINGLKGKITVILTSHYLEEIEALCDRVAVMTRGRIKAVGTVEELKSITGEEKFEEAFVRLAEDGQ